MVYWKPPSTPKPSTSPAEGASVGEARFTALPLTLLSILRSSLLSTMLEEFKTIRRMLSVKRLKRKLSGEKREEELWVTSRQYNEQGFAAAKAAAFAAEFTASPQLGDWTEPDHLAFNDFTGRMYRRRPFSDSAESLNSLEAIRSQQPWQLNGYRSHRSPRTLMRQYDNLDALISVRRPIDMSVLPPIMEMEEKAESFMESECSEESLFLADNDDPMSSAASSQVNIDIMTGYVDAYEFVKADSKSSWLWTARGQDLQSLERAETQTLQATKSVTSYTSLSPEDVYTYQRAAGPLRITNATVESF